MILFIAPNPKAVKDREGFMQRVNAIDDVFSSEKRVYWSDLKTNHKKAKALQDADTIYVHSIYNSNKIQSFYSLYGYKIITDLHGVVPEEELYADNHEMARIMDVTEKDVFSHGRYFVAVTNAMVKHFEDKYPTTKNRSWVVLPIYGEGECRPVDKDLSTKKMVVYAGGDQKWQNVDMMVGAINKTAENYKFTILTHSPAAFKEIDPAVHANVTVKSVPSKDVKNYYKKASFGFILRNDTLVNTVACPTKLIEYLCYGIVPIVLSEKIGDFNAMGYKYITLKKFLSNELTQEELDSAIKHNYSVYTDFAHQTKKSILKLVGIHKSISKLRKQHTEDNLMTLSAQCIEAQEKINDAIRFEYQVEEHRKKIIEYADLAENYRKHIEQIDITKHSSVVNIPKRIYRKVKRSIAQGR